MSSQGSMWVEKYRPETLDDIVGHDEIVSRLKKYTGDSEVPHMLFAGPPGVGKTATITAFAREVFGDNWRSNLDELNASDERGIDVIRDKVKGIARSTPAGGADFSILFLDEADQLSRDAQPALRRVMEDYSDVTRFFMSCNYESQIIQPLQSRTTMFRFSGLSDDEIMELLTKVAEAEDLEYEELALQRIIRDSRGDARKAIGALQSAAVDGAVTEDSARTVVGLINDELVEEIVDLAIAGETDEAMQTLDVELLKQGANAKVLADSFLRVLKRKDMPAPGRRKVITKLAETDWRIGRAANPNIQWHSFIADIHVGYHLDHEKYDD